MKGILITLGVLLVIGGIVGYIFYNQKSTEKWNTKCISSGGIVKESGKVCDYINCDHSKYSCNMYS